jgi:hypothetical protein
MTKRLTLVMVMLCALAIVPCVASAAVVTLTFEGIGNNAPVGNFYNGGAGPNYGIQFGADALGLVSGLAGGSGNFSGAPTMPTVIYFLSGPGDVMDVAAGFDTGFSFYYSAVVYPGSVSVWSGLDGTGSLLASLDLPVTPSGGSAECTYGNYCPWEPIGVAFSGIAESVNFSGVADYIAFDNVTLGASIPTSGVPEPYTFLMLAGGLGIVALKRLRKA